MLTPSGGRLSPVNFSRSGDGPVMKRMAALALAGALACGPALAAKGDAGPPARSWEIARTLVQLSDGEFEAGIRQAAGEAYDASYPQAENPAARQAFLDLAQQAMVEVKGRMLEDSIDGLARGMSLDELERYLAFQENPAVARLREHQPELRAAYTRSEAEGRAYLATLLAPEQQAEIEAMLKDPDYIALQAKVRKLSASLGEPYGEQQAATFGALLKQECGEHPDYPWCAEQAMTAKAAR